MPFNKISVIGLGYIGLPTAALFASRKIKVTGVDVNRQAVDTINSGNVHIVEPQLDILVHATVKEGYLKATLTPEAADAFIIAVPTPFQVDQATQNYEADLSHLKSAIESIAPVVKAGDLIVLESTSPVGTTERIASWLAELRHDLAFPKSNGSPQDVYIAHCPERVLPGHAVRELVENDRVIGGITPSCAKRARDLYQLVVEGDCYLTDARTAEMAKLTENAYRDVNIAFANELALICSDIGIDVWELISLSNRHPRVNILQPGAGVGGHCIAVDPWFIVAASPLHSKLIKTAREVNNSKPRWVIDQARAKATEIAEANSKPVIACYGISFKPDIDDLRESPALEIVHELASSGFEILLVEPHIECLPSNLKKFNVHLHKLDTAIAQSNINLLLVKHKHFKENLGLFEKAENLFDFVGLLSEPR